MVLFFWVFFVFNFLCKTSFLALGFFYVFFSFGGEGELSYSAT